MALFLVHIRWKERHAFEQLWWHSLPLNLCESWPGFSQTMHTISSGSCSAVAEGRRELRELALAQALDGALRALAT